MSGLTVYKTDVEVPARRIRLRSSGAEGFSFSAAADGTPAFAGIVFDDPGGDMAVRGWESIVAEETRCVEAPRLYTGFVGPRRYRRGPYKSGASREIDTDIVDANILLRTHRINGADSLRPEETDTERLKWLLESGYIPLVSDLGLVNGADRVFEATQYKNKHPFEVLDDLIGPRGQIYFVYWDPAEEALGLFYDDPAATTFTSRILISNVIEDVDGDASGMTFYPYFDATSELDPSEIISNLAYLYKGARVYRQAPATAAEFFDDNGIGHRDGFVENDLVGKQATAITFADRILARNSKEQQTIDLVLRLPAEKVGLIQAGHRLQVRLLHVPNFTSFTWTRVETMVVMHTEANRDFYDVGLKLSTRGKIGPGGGGDTGEFPHEPGGTLPQSISYNDNEQGVNDGSIPPTADGDLLVLFVASRLAVAPLGDISGWTRQANTNDLETLFGTTRQYAALYTRAATAGETTPYTPAAGELFTIENWGSATFMGTVVNAEQSGSALDCGSVTTTGPATIVGCALSILFDALTSSTAPGSGVTERSDFRNNSGNTPNLWSGYTTVTEASTVNVTGTITCSDPSRIVWGALSYWMQSDASDNPPQPGQEEPWTVVTMNGAEGTTDFPYAAGSLKLRLNGLPISPASYTETIPDCGDFTLSWVPFPDDVITASYQGA